MIRFFKNKYHLFKALLARLWFGDPSHKLKVIGVTGTDGKTTTSVLIYHILKSAGKRVSLISTVYAKIGKHEFSTGLHTTTPDGIVVQQLLSESVKNGDEYFVLETTSHALDQNRIFGVDCEIAVLTNVTHEHLDYHKTYENYLKAKSKLFEHSKISLLNRDDKSFEPMKKILDHTATQVKSYGTNNDAGVRGNLGKKINRDLSSYNEYNFLAAYAVCKECKISDSIIFEAMKSYRFPKGRMETVYEGLFTIIIDFAHTPNAIDHALRAVKPLVKSSGKLIHVFGSAGLRDASKRPLMGKASSRWADRIILTEEDYRTEDPLVIAQSIAQGINKAKSSYQIITDRHDAIEEAVRMAGKGDVIIITGKGHEQSLCRGTKEFPWDDAKAVKEILHIFRPT